MEDELKAIKQLMEELQNEMKYSPEDFEERLGRKKPDGVEVIKIEGSPDEMPTDEMSDESEMPEGMEEESPEDKLKARLMKMRG